MTYRNVVDDEDHGLVKPGWYCSRERGHEGPCAAWPVSHETADQFFGPADDSDRGSMVIVAMWGFALMGAGVGALVTYLIMR